MSINIVDQNLPGLSAINEDELKRITGSNSVALLRLRYRPGKRAVLHIKTHNDKSESDLEGVIWYFAGDKAKRLNRRLCTDAIFDDTTGALYERFPMDHRLPELQCFMSLPTNVVRDFIGGQVVGEPILLRYRPGISCTFKYKRQDGQHVFVKILAKENIASIDALNQRIIRILGNKDVAVARSISTYIPSQAIAYEEATGVALSEVAVSSNAKQMYMAIRRVAMALERLWCIPAIKTRELDRNALLTRSANALKIVTALNEEAGELAKSLIDTMAAQEFEARRQLIHGDMKLEHVFLDSFKVTFIDTESLSIGDPDYDIAKLEARLVAAYLTNQIPAKNLIQARKALANYTSPNYGWFLDAATLQTAKFFAQRPSEENFRLCQAMLSREH